MPDVRGNHGTLNIMENDFLDAICPFEEICDVVFRLAWDEYAESRDLGTVRDYISKDGFSILGDTLIQRIYHQDKGLGEGETLERLNAAVNELGRHEFLGKIPIGLR